MPDVPKRWVRHTPEVLGNCKFDQASDASKAEVLALKRSFGIVEGVPVIVIGSTRGDEEEDLVIEAVRRIGSHRVQVIHAPRHIERVPEIAVKVAAAFGSVSLRSRGGSGPYQVLDTYGELAGVYALADIVIIGGGFSNLGGQNLIQPLALGKPVIHGPHMQNFRDASVAADRVGATIVAADVSELTQAIEQLLGDPTKRQRMGDAAAAMIRENLGASRRYAEAIASEAAKVWTR